MLAVETDTFNTIPEAIDAIAAGELIIVTDDEDRENEGDLVMAASLATPEKVNAMIRYARGLICVPTTEPQLKRLGINPMVANNRESHKTDFTVSVDASEGITTGISAADRCHTIHILANPQSTADQLVQPGHIFPLRSRPGGVLERAGHTEAAVDLTSLAGLPPTSVICEVLNEDGTMARLPELIEFRKQHGLKMVSIKQLIEYRHSREQLVEKIGQQTLENDLGCFDLHIFRSILDNRIHFALTLGDMEPGPTLVRVQSENILADVFHFSTGFGTKTPLDAGLARIARDGRGAFVYITRPCGGLDLKNKVPGEPAKCEVEVSSKNDFRSYGLGAQILTALGLKQIRLLSSSNRRHIALDGYGLEIVEHLPM